VLLHLSHYFVSYPSDPGADYYWYHGWEEAGAYLRAHAGEHSEVRVPTKPTNYVDKFLLYHTARDPALYQAQGWAGTPYTFAPTCSYRAEGARPGVLYLVILEGWPLPEECRYDDLGLEAVHEVRFPDGKLAFLFLARPA
jgi:hypothetical protein